MVSLSQSLKLPSSKWVDISSRPLKSLCICKMSIQSNQAPVVIISLNVNADLTWFVYAHSHCLNYTSKALLSIPQILDGSSLNNLLDLLEKLHICIGQPDSHFVSMVQAKKGSIVSPDGKVVACLDQYTPLIVEDTCYSATVRTKSCEVLTTSYKYSSCKAYRSNLHAIYNRWCKRSVTPSTDDTSSHSNHRYLGSPQKKRKMLRLRQRVHSIEKTVDRLKATVTKLTQEQSVLVDSDLSDDLLGVMKENHERIQKAYPEGSFARLFWDEQLKAGSVKASQQYQWHPLMIKFCLNLKLISSAAYHAARTSGFLRLPSERTLRDYTSYFKCKPGFQPELNEMLKKESNIDSLPESKKYIINF